MHAVMMDGLEEYLSGTLDPAVQRRIDAHLSECPMCREEIRSMQDVSQLFVSLRSEEEWEPAPSLYPRVIESLAERRTTPSFAGLLGLDFAFGRRVVFASLLTMAIVGSYLVTRENSYPGEPSPEAVMAQQNSPSFDSAPARDNMLVTLTAYEQH